MKSDILTEITPDKYSEVLDTLRKDWPGSIHIYYLLKNFINWAVKTDEVQIQIYCPENKVQDGVFVVVVEYKIQKSLNTVMLHCVDETGLEKLGQILRETSMIDWTKNVDFEASHEKLVPLLEAVAEEKHLEYDKMAYHQLWLPPAKSKNITLEDLSSDGLELRDLEEQHTDIINRTWAYTEGLTTENFVKATIVLNGGVGLFLKGNDNPIAWNTIQHFYGLGMLYTLDKYRQKGYASIVTKALSKKLAEAGIDPYACIKYDNVPSFSMFNKLGFEKVCMVYWGSMKPKTK